MRKTCSEGGMSSHRQAENTGTCVSDKGQPVGMVKQSQSSNNIRKGMKARKGFFIRRYMDGTGEHIAS